MIVKAHLDEEYAIAPNALFQDTSLGLDAQALMGWFLSLPENWTVRLEHVAKHWNINLARVKRVMNELKKAG